MTKKLLFLIVFLMQLLVLRLFLFYNHRIQYTEGQALSFETTLLSDPKFAGNYQNLSVNLPTGELIFIQTAGYPEYLYGEELAN
jgi:hypothetical protein